MKNEDGLAKKIRNGDMGAFEQVFRRYYEALCAFALVYVKDHDLVEEMVQDVFYQFWEKREKLKIETSLKSYLYSMVKNKCLQYIRREKIGQRVMTQVKADYELTENPDPASVYRMAEMNKTFQEALDELPARTRKVFELSRFEGKKYKEIAQLLSISIKTVEANMGKALKHFRLRMHDYLETA
ncbi:MAG: RNA polymerase sigma-70 factor [Bacteroidales bacterium]|jgi:RNA polymerase sigma-70 factor (ECF subfamily)